MRHYFWGILDPTRYPHDTRFFPDFDTLVNSNRPQDKQFRGTRFFLGHIDRVPRGLTVL